MCAASSSGSATTVPGPDGVGSAGCTPAMPPAPVPAVAPTAPVPASTPIPELPSTPEAPLAPPPLPLTRPPLPPAELPSVSAELATEPETPAIPVALEEIPSSRPLHAATTLQAARNTKRLLMLKAPRNPHPPSERRTTVARALH
jgi:hypothetical protein